MTNVNGAFANDQKATMGARSLAGTTELTNTAAIIAADIMKAIEADFEVRGQMLEESKTNHQAMDKLITEMYDLSTVNIDFLKELDEQTIDGMLKSQQSKRSRAKSKTMTLDNYMAMMTGAVAENILRLITGKKKSVGARRVGIEFTEEELKELANDQELLRKEIRNVQSKKSIMRSKADFNEECEDWLKILEAEKALKGLRSSNDVTKAALVELLNEVVIDELKAAEAKELLGRIKELVV